MHFVKKRRMICKPEVTVLLYHPAAKTGLRLSDSLTTRRSQLEVIAPPRRLTPLKGAGCGGFTSLIHPSATKLVVGCLKS